MRPGTWLQPRHGSEEAFKKDFPAWDPSSTLDVACPGCGKTVKLSHKSPAGRNAGWCKTCNRGVAS